MFYWGLFLMKHSGKILTFIIIFEENYDKLEFLVWVGYVTSQSRNLNDVWPEP